jgi:hypothetical protein
VKVEEGNLSKKDKEHRSTGKRREIASSLACFHVCFIAVAPVLYYRETIRHSAIRGL